MINTDLAIIGGGIAGVSAAVYAKRSGLNFLFFEPKAIGGQLFFMDTVDNYIGLGTGAKGRDLIAKLNKTLTDLKIDILAEEVIKVEIKDGCLNIYSDNNSYCARSAIISTGASFRKLGVKGEDEFTGRGVSYCAVCDGFFFKGKDVAVVGGGNTAVEEALYLSDICRKVYIIHRRDKFRAMDYLQKHIFLKKNIEMIFDSAITGITGKDSLSGITIANVKTGQISSLELHGLFVAVGVLPNTSILKNVIKLDANDFVVTDELMKTSSDFIFSCGDCRSRPLRQLITAASEGAIAALGAYKYLKGHYISV